MIRVGSLFSGIGGFDLGLERAGMSVSWQVEIEPYCNKVLAKHWPNVTRYGDIKTINWSEVESVDLVCGGFPCQPFSLAGKRRGKDDDRYLWPEVVRCLRAIKPTWFLGENVPGIINLALDQVCTDLEAIGYEVVAFNIPACAVGAPHIRKRIWLLAYAVSEQSERRRNGIERGERSQGEVTADGWERSAASNVGWSTEPNVGRVAHGVPARVDRLRGLGNAIVPDIAEAFGRMIMRLS